VSSGGIQVCALLTICSARIDAATSLQGWQEEYHRPPPVDFFNELHRIIAKHRVDVVELLAYCIGVLPFVIKGSLSSVTVLFHQDAHQVRGTEQFLWPDSMTPFRHCVLLSSHYVGGAWLYVPKLLSRLGEN
jgi:hypothetical protein